MLFDYFFRGGSGGMAGYGMRGGGDYLMTAMLTGAVVLEV